MVCVLLTNACMDKSLVLVHMQDVLLLFYESVQAVRYQLLASTTANPALQLSVMAVARQVRLCGCLGSESSLLPPVSASVIRFSESPAGCPLQQSFTTCNKLYACLPRKRDTHYLKRDVCHPAQTPHLSRKRDTYDGHAVDGGMLRSWGIERLEEL
jgi:hypothetical protein